MNLNTQIYLEYLRRKAVDPENVGDYLSFRLYMLARTWQLPR